MKKDQGTRVCKVCGKEYPYCQKVIRTEMFRWQDVACCPEHAETYLQQILESRGESKENKGASDG